VSTIKKCKALLEKANSVEQLNSLKSTFANLLKYSLWTKIMLEGIPKREYPRLFYRYFKEFLEVLAGKPA
jgi:hypothetical protein